MANTFIGALYHPPRPQYSTGELLTYIEACVDELNQEYPLSPIVLAGDFNQLADDDVAEKTGLLQIVHQPTRGQNVLDRIFVSCPLYSTIRVVTLIVRSDHKAVVAYAVQPKFAAKTTTTKTFRPISPSQHAQFLYYISNFVFPEIGLTTPRNVQTEFRVFYDTALRLLNHSGAYHHSYI